MIPRSIPKPFTGLSGVGGLGVVVRTATWTSTRIALRTTRISLTLPPAANSAIKRVSLEGRNLMTPSPLIRSFHQPQISSGALTIDGCGSSTTMLRHRDRDLKRG